MCVVVVVEIFFLLHSFDRSFVQCQACHFCMCVFLLPVEYYSLFIFFFIFLRCCFFCICLFYYDYVCARVLPLFGREDNKEQIDSKAQKIATKYKYEKCFLQKQQQRQTTNAMRILKLWIVDIMLNASPSCNTHIIKSLCLACAFSESLVTWITNDVFWKHAIHSWIFFYHLFFSIRCVCVRAF